MTAAQTLCLALGLWIQYQFVVQTEKWNQSHPKASIQQSNDQPAVSTANGNDEILKNLAFGSLAAFAWIAGLHWAIASLFWSRVRSEQHDSDVRYEHESMQQLKELLRTRDAIIFGLAKLAESRDPETGQHLERIAEYSTCLAAACRRHPYFHAEVTPQFVKSIGISSALHDIGKVGVPDSILLKPSPLTPDERLRMQDHPQVGADCIHEIGVQLGNANFLEMAKQIALCHHEKWDGTGYPNQLAGDETPLTARIVAIADVYDALSVRRVYKAAFSHQKCVDIIQADAGKHFDPKLVEVFLKVEHKFRQIAEKYSESIEAESESPKLRNPSREMDDALNLATSCTE